MLHSYVTVFEVNRQVEELTHLEYSVQKEAPPLYAIGSRHPCFFDFERRKRIQGSFIGRNGMLDLGDPLELRVKYRSEDGKEVLVELQGLCVSDIEKRNTVSVYHFTDSYMHKQLPQTNEEALTYLQKGDW